MATAAIVETLRSQAIAIEPLRIDPVFDDPERVLAFIAEHAPYPTLAKYHGFARGGATARRCCRGSGPISTTRCSCTTRVGS